jgi:glycosyltransferase involved in cell wall biosynthesis
MKKVTIVVAVLNGAKTIRRCLDSIVSQRDVEKEVIVLDGLSTDGTVEIVREYSDHLHRFESKKDGGIYSAWNQAIEYSTGDWVCFLGADDAFTSEHSLHDLLCSVNDDTTEIVASRGNLVDESGRTIKVFGGPWIWERVIHYVTFCHPGMLHSRELLKRVGTFDTKYRIGADYDFFMRAGPSTKAIFVDEAKVFVGNAGISRSRAELAFREHYEIQRKYGYLSNAAILKTKIVATLKYKLKRVLGLA